MPAINRVLSLTKVLLNNTWGLSKAKYEYLVRRERTWELVLILLSIIFIFGLFASVFGLATDYLYDQLAPIGQQSVVLAVVLLICQVVVFVLGVILAISIFYFSRDTEILLPLPFHPYEVVVAKFAVVLINEYLSLLGFLAPVLVVYGIKAQGGVAYWLSALVTFLFVPLLPLGLACLLTFLVMRFVNLSSRKELITLLGGFLLLGVVIVFQFYVQTQAEHPEQLLESLFSEEGLVLLLSRRFPPSLWFTRALTQAGNVTGLGGLLLLAGTSVCMLALAVGVGQLAFYRSLVFGMEADRGKDKQLKLDYTPRRVVFAVAANEFRLFFRRAVYVLNGLAGLIVLPVMLLFPFISQSSAIGEIFAEISGPLPFIAFFAGFGYSVLQTGLTALPVTAFSREGKELAILKALPISFTTLFLGKLFAIQAIILLGSLAGVIVLGVLLQALDYALLGFGVSILASTAFSSNLMLIDLKRPYLDWTNPQQAIKSNVNSLIGMGVTFVVAGIVGFLARQLYVQGVSFGGILFFTTLVSALWLGLSYLLVKRSQHLWYGQEF
ncbi:MAG TPA: hypothetical protein GXX57_02295 [Firmicutes bacterium]|nr:hypothetical protein [Bacillota bacterium]